MREIKGKCLCGTVQYQLNDLVLISLLGVVNNIIKTTGKTL